ncbi:MAG: CsgG/HfaB family protein, partial [Alphaproteobacteria bacterium]
VPTFAVGEVADKTGKIDYNDEGHKMSQGVTEMVMSALGRTGMVNLVERFDLRIPLAEMRMAEQNFIPARLSDFKLQTFDFLVLGAVTELNFNIVSGGVGLGVAGIGASTRSVIINVALDLRVVDRRTFGVRFIRSLQKQIYGYEVGANVFRFFGTTLIEFEAGKIKNEPIQLGLRSVVEMAVYQIMTDFLGLPASSGCALESGFFEETPAKTERVSP